MLRYSKTLVLICMALSTAAALAQGSRHQIEGARTEDSFQRNVDVCDPTEKYILFASSQFNLMSPVFLSESGDIKVSRRFFGNAQIFFLWYAAAVVLLYACGSRFGKMGNQ